MPKTALEVTVSQNSKDIADMQLGFKDVVAAINGLRKDMADRSEKTIQILNDQNLMLVTSQSNQQASIIKELTDHKAEDMLMFSDIKSRMSYYIGGGAALAALISTCIVAADMWLRK